MIDYPRNGERIANRCDKIGKLTENYERVILNHDGYWLLEYEYIDCPEGYRKVEINRVFLHRSHKVAYAMLKRWNRGETAITRYQRMQWEKREAAE